MCDQNDRAGEIEQIAFEHFERRDIQIVCGLIEQQNVGGLQHQPRDMNSRPLSAGEPVERQFQLVLPEQESRRPSRHMLRTIAENHRIAPPGARARRKG